jgi:hypothetical protein
VVVSPFAIRQSPRTTSCSSLACKHLYIYPIEAPCEKPSKISVFSASHLLIVVYNYFRPVKNIGALPALSVSWITRVIGNRGRSRMS